MPKALQAICRILRSEDDFLIASHLGPDGDAFGSTVALGHVLAALGKRFAMYNASGLPAEYDWLELPGPFVDKIPDQDFSRAVVVDCGSLARAGQDIADRFDAEKIINIDHHLHNPMFGALNWVETTHPAVGNMIAELADALDVPLVGPLAQAVYLAVATDTGFFTFGNTTPESLELTARLMRQGLDLGGINAKITKTWTPNRMRLWSEVWSGVELFLDGRLGLGVISQEMYERTKTSKADSDSLINFILRMKSVRVAAILREELGGGYKLSLRSHGADNVQAMAATFGGGGHKNAAGGSIRADLDTARQMLTSAVAKMLGGEA